MDYFTTVKIHKLTHMHNVHLTRHNKNMLKEKKSHAYHSSLEFTFERLTKLTSNIHPYGNELMTHHAK